MLQEINKIGVCKNMCRKGRGIKKLFGGCPRKYVNILQMCDKTKFFEAPDYEQIYKLLKQAMIDTHAEVS